MVELLHGSLGLDVASVEPDSSANRPVWCFFTMSVSEFLVGGVRNGNLFAEILVERMEVGGGELGFMTRDVISGDVEMRIIPFIGKEWRNAGSCMRSVVVYEFGDGE